MSQAGNIIGYGFGFLPLASLPIIRLLGGDQFRKFCVIVMFVLVITVWITCYTQTEEERILQRQPEGYVTSVLKISRVYNSLQNLSGNLEQYLRCGRRSAQTSATCVLCTNLCIYGLVRAPRLFS